MSIESGPKPDNEVLETPVPESEMKESIMLSFDAIKDIIISQIGSRAEIQRLEITEENEGAKLRAEIDAGILGGKISVDGLIANTPNGIIIKDLNINARGYIKSRIEGWAIKMIAHPLFYFSYMPLFPISLETQHLFLKQLPANIFR